MKKNSNESIFENIQKNLIKSDDIDNIFKIGFNIKYSNDKLYNFVKNKIDIPLKSIDIFPVDRDGNIYSSTDNSSISSFDFGINEENN